MASESHTVQAERKRLRAEWERGMVEGMESYTGPMPWFYNKPYKEFTSYERGYVYGHEYMVEMHDA